MSDIKLIITDLDGTFLSDFYHVSRGNQKATQRAQQKGVPCCACTTRNWALASHVIQTGMLWGKAALCNGAAFVRTRDKALLSTHCLPGELLRPMVEMSLEAGGKIALYTHTYALYMPACTPAHYPRIQKEWQGYVTEAPVPVKVCHSLDEMITLGYRHTQLIEVFSTKGAPMPKSWEDGIRALGDVVIANPNRGIYHICPRKATKKQAAQALADHYQIPREQVMCLGDANSDLEMIQWAGLGVAMGNAEPAVKQAADLVSPPNDQDGFAWALAQAGI